MHIGKSLGRLLFLLFLLAISACNQAEIQYDIVIENAQVIDPESNTNQVLNVGVIGNKIEYVGSEAIVGKRKIDASGMVLSPGFIDLHAHGQTNQENSYQAYDGVTTALDLEIGVDTIQQWLAARTNKSLLNYGASACLLAYRNKVILNNNRVLRSIFDELSDTAINLQVPATKFAHLRNKLNEALQLGAIGIGVPVGYIPNASANEIGDIYAFAGKMGVPVFSHVREGGAIAIQQAIADAILNKTSLHICHINSMARKDITYCLQLVEKAQKMGFDITTELYPYTAGNTEISSAIFNAGWQERLGCTYNDLQWVETGERLTPESFEKYRKTGGSVIIHMMKESWISEAIQSPATMIASDGGTFSPLGHPRSAGTFCKVLRKYVKEDSLISLEKAIEKMTLMPAKLLEKVVPDMKLRGRIRLGCFADLCLFKLSEIRDNATFERGFTKSTGMKYVLVNGQILIENGKLKPNCFPGVAVKGEPTQN